MVMSENQARQNYENGIQRIGIQAYRNAANESTISGAAETLENAKEQNLSANEMAEAWASRY